MDFWNSAESLSHITRNLQGIAVFAAILAAILGASVYFINNRKTELEMIQREQDKKTISVLEEKTKDIKELKQRSLDDISKNKIIKELASTNGTKILLIVNNSKESRNYMRQFGELFKAVGWDVKHFSTPDHREAHEMYVGKNSKYQNSASYDGLVKAMKECGFEFKSCEFNSNDGYELIFDAGVIDVNPYQEVLDKTDL